MHVILLLLGIAVTAAGGAMLAYGISNNGFDVGNALIIAGTTAVAGGLIIIGLSAAVRELGRMTRMLDLRLPARAAPAAAAPERGREKAPGKKPAAAPAEAPAQSAPDLSAVLAEPPVEPTAQEAPKVDPLAPSRGDTRPREGAREKGFDSVWAPSSAAKPDGNGTDKPAAADQVRVQKDVRAPGEPLPIRPSREPQAVTILKSGVIEGMAYTLYSDGSIEADLPQGMARFSSIEALRRHLDEHG